MAAKKQKKVVSEGSWQLAKYPWKQPSPIMITAKFGPLSMNGQVVEDHKGKEVKPPTQSQMKALYDYDPSFAKFFTPPAGYIAPWSK